MLIEEQCKDGAAPDRKLQWVQCFKLLELHRGWFSLTQRNQLSEREEQKYSQLFLPTLLGPANILVRLSGDSSLSLSPCSGLDYKSLIMYQRW